MKHSIFHGLFYQRLNAWKIIPTAVQIAVGIDAPLRLAHHNVYTKVSVRLMNPYEFVNSWIHGLYTTLHSINDLQA